MKTSDLEYDLPRGCVATQPREPRDSARLMVVRRGGGEILAHASVRDLPGFVRPGDRFLFNTSRVLPARFFARRETGGRVEGLYLHDAPSGGGWSVLLRGKGLKAGARLTLENSRGEPSGVTLTPRSARADQAGSWDADVSTAQPAAEILGRIGLMPLPPYILAARKEQGEEVVQERDAAVYQTVYANQAGSVAAPTAGLHFTPGLLERLDAAGVRRLEAVLHVGAGTFRPIEAERVEDHPMHAERCSMTPGVMGDIRWARAEGKRVFAVGTTSARTLESYAAAGEPFPASLSTRLLIAPGYRWLLADGLMTNFHLPRSTLLLLVGAMFDGGVSKVKELYAEAIGRGYRFYSYGDAMLIVP